MKLRFNDVKITRQDLVNQVLQYEYFPYHPNQSQVWITEKGLPAGYLNCYGLLLIAARDLTLLPDDFDINLSPGVFSQPVVKSLWQILFLNGNKKDKYEVKPGDVLLMRYRDVDPKLNEPHHVAICIKEEPITILHAEATQMDGKTGSVRRSVIAPGIDPIMWDRVTECWSMNNFIAAADEDLVIK